MKKVDALLDLNVLRSFVRGAFFDNSPLPQIDRKFVFLRLVGYSILFFVAKSRTNSVRRFVQTYLLSLFSFHLFLLSPFSLLFSLSISCLSLFSFHPFLFPISFYLFSILLPPPSNASLTSELFVVS